MILIIGGAYQGKQSYASKTYNLTDPDWKDGQTCTIEDLKTAKAVHHFHSFIRRELDEGGSVRDLAEIIWKENPDLIIVTDEVGYGIVPMDAKDREWREACGRVCTKLAAHAAQVVRVCCGIGTQLKREKEKTDENISDPAWENTWESAESLYRDHR